MWGTNMKKRQGILSMVNSATLTAISLVKGNNMMRNWKNSSEREPAMDSNLPVVSRLLNNNPTMPAMIKKAEIAIAATMF